MPTTGGILTKPRVYLVDDHPVVRSYLALLLETQAGLKVVGVSEDAGEARRQILDLKPDLAIIDLIIEGGHGLDLVRELSQELPDLRILVFSAHEESVFATRAIQAGALGFVGKTSTPQEILNAVNQVRKGQIYLSQRMYQIPGLNLFRTRPSHPESNTAGNTRRGNPSRLDQVPREARSRPEYQNNAPLDLSSLSDRELQVFMLIGEGRETREIAQSLKVEVKTVETYRARIKVKLHLQTASQLLLAAHEAVHRSGQGQRSGSDRTA